MGQHHQSTSGSTLRRRRALALAAATVGAGAFTVELAGFAQASTVPITPPPTTQSTQSTQPVRHVDQPAPEQSVPGAHRHSSRQGSSEPTATGSSVAGCGPDSAVPTTTSLAAAGRMRDSLPAGPVACDLGGLDRLL
jgi:hypothetical protein